MMAHPAALRPACILAVILTSTVAVVAQAPWGDLGSEELSRYFEQRVASLEGPLEEPAVAVSGRPWVHSTRPALRSELLGMLGLDPMPEKTALQTTVTGTIERDDFTVEKLHFQSMPGLYVTANLYLPKQHDGNLPAVLYVCGHSRVKIDGVSYGNKVGYHHHGIWFARNGYACLMIDTLQLGEIEGMHHGTHRENRWWWHARGYTPAGVEAWNCVRALDYLQSRPEIDGGRLGVTGRSGGGAYSWWIAAIDDRIKAAVPVAGITSLRNHVVDGCIEGHCDCMFMVNTHAWDFELVAALVAPRPLLISNTDKDRIFPLDGVFHVYRSVRRVYEEQDALQNLGLNIEEGPHKDTQPLRTSAFHWLNRHLKGAAPSDTVEMAAVKMFEPRELKVFDELPADQINTRIDALFVPMAPPPEVPGSRADWDSFRDIRLARIRRKCFAGWPSADPPAGWEAGDLLTTGNGIALRLQRVDTGDGACCYLAVPEDPEKARAGDQRVVVCDENGWAGILEVAARSTVYLLPRGVGPTAWSEEPKKRIQIRRRFALTGQTLDGMRVWDIMQGIRALRAAMPESANLTLEARGSMAGNVLYAALFSDHPVERLILRDLPLSHREGPIYLNVLRILDLPAAVAIAAERSEVIIDGSADDWRYPLDTARALGWPGRPVTVSTAN